MVDRDPDAWRLVDEGWGRRAAEFATLSEPANAREYVALHHRLGITDGDRLLDLACGSGLALELATLRGASVAGIDASDRLIAVAQDRLPGGDLRVGDMHALPWEDHSFDVVTSFRGIWGTTPEALAEARRVLVPGGRLGFTVWGHIKTSPGAWALSPFRLASQPKVENQANMVALGRPGAGEELLSRYGFEDVSRMTVPFAWEFADPESYARALASTGPAYEAIQSVGEEEFLRWATEMAREHVRDGLPLRAEIDVVGLPGSSAAGRRRALAARHPRRLLPGCATAGARGAPAVRRGRGGPRLRDERDAPLGTPAGRARGALRADRGHGEGGRPQLPRPRHPDRPRWPPPWATPPVRSRGEASSPEWRTRTWRQACSSGADEGLSAAERALADWARRVTDDPNATTAADLDELRAAGYDDRQIVAITLFVGLRIAFSTVNDALGSHRTGAGRASPGARRRDLGPAGRRVA